ncbi:MAG TPA: PfkB family carbohydrate kinase [Streptosporangiaceae bacterium]
MILVVSLNPALDLTYEVETADWAGVNRPHTVHVRPGGKGVNVARTLRALGREVRLVGLIGGAAGAELAELLAGSGIEVAFTAIAGHTRRTLTVVDSARDQAALFNEPGPLVEPGEYAEFVAAYRAALDECDVVVLSGSLPGGVGAEAYAGLIVAARAASVPVILDTSGSALIVGAAAGPTLIKPNLAELEQVTGRSLGAEPARVPASASAPASAPASPPTSVPGPVPTVASSSATSHATPAPVTPPDPPSALAVDSAPSAGAEPATSGEPCCRSGCIGGTSVSLVEEAARELARGGAEFVVVSLGAAGLLAVTGEGSWLARPGERVDGNPTGAGDAVVAGLADGLMRGLGWPALLRQAVALGAATVAAAVAGEFASQEYERQHRSAMVRPGGRGVGGAR